MLEYIAALYGELERREAMRAATPEEAREANAALRRMMADFSSPFVPELPRFTGGAVGYLGYDTAAWFEPVALQPVAELDDEADYQRAILVARALGMEDVVGARVHDAAGRATLPDPAGQRARHPRRGIHTLPAARLRAPWQRARALRRSTPSRWWPASWAGRSSASCRVSRAS